jgi:hypothetical protein
VVSGNLDSRSLSILWSSFCRVKCLSLSVECNIKTPIAIEQFGESDSTFVQKMYDGFYVDDPLCVCVCGGGGGGGGV